MPEPYEPLAEGVVDIPRLGDSFLRDQAIRLALAGYSLEDSLEVLKRHQTAAASLVEQQQGQRLSLTDNALRAATARLEQAEQERKSVSELGDQRKALASENELLAEKREKLKARVRSKRRQQQAAAIQGEASRRAQRAREVPKEALSARLAAAQEVFEVEEKCWSINQEEYKRRAEELREHLTHLEKEIDSCSARTDALKQRNITKTVAGFLVWAGYLGFAATGSAISYLLHDRPTSDGGHPWSLLTGLTALLQRVDEAIGLWWTLLASFGALLVLLLVFGCIVRITDRILRRFDRRWGRGPIGQGRRQKGRGTLDISPSLSPVAQLLQLPSIERASFVQLIASLPYVFAAGLVFLLVSLAGALAPENSLGSLVPTYVGTVYALLVTSALLLYVIYIALPRAEHGTQESVQKRGALSLVKAHWELAALALFLLLALALSAFLPRGGIYDRVVWGSVALGMTMAGLGLAYGLVYHGLFRDVDRLLRIRRELKTAVNAFSARPTIRVEGLFDLEEIWKGLSDSLSEEEDFEFFRSLSALVFAVADDPRSISSLLDFWLEATGESDRPARKRLREFVAHIAESESPDIDFEVAPEESSEIHRTTLKLLENRHSMSVLEEEVARRKPLAEALSERQEECEKLKQVRLKAADELELARRVLALQHEREELAFRAAFALGETFAPLTPPSQTPPLPSAPEASEAKIH